MSYKKQLEKMGATPGKLALIGLLSLVLVGVVAKQLPEGTAQTASKPSAPVSTSRKVAQKLSTQDSPEEPERENELTPWPEIDLTKTLAIDPFATPAWVAKKEQPTTTPLNVTGVLADLQQQGASIVVITAEDKSATIGEQNVHVGDILEGYRVTDITAQGILLNKYDPR